VHVVARAEVLDAVSGGKRTTEYAYHHGYWDGEEREFHGFGRVDTRDTESFADHNASGLHGDRSFTPVPERSFSPPVERRTWFHPGAVEDGAGGWGENDLSGEYWAEPWPGAPGAALLPRPAWVAGLLAGLPPRDRRDALRALRGRVIRTELYARDGSEREGLPYTVAESLYGLREEQPPAEGDARRRIFFPHLLAERTTEWERGSDPMTRVTFTDLYDRFGQPRSRVAVAVPRGRDPRAEGEWAEPYLATHEVTVYAVPAEDGRLIAGCVAHATTWELAGVRDGSVHTLRERALLRDPAAPRRVLAQTLHHYDGEAFEGLPLGQVGPRGAVVRTETLVLTPEGAAEAYGEQLPPWLADDPAAADWSAYPAEFRERLAPGAGYVRRHAAEGSPVVDGWFAVTGREYDFQRFPTGWRGLVMRERDPMGRETETWYDRYLLLPRLVRNAAGLATDANYDYRTLKPRRVRDPNGNRSFVRYNALGQVAETALAGKVGETVGDPDGGASTLFTYDLRAFHERGVPVSVTTVRRVHHETDPDVDAAERGRTVRSVEFSDGFGRVVQTRTQAAETAFGEERFGGEVIPANPAEAPGDAVGRPASGAPRVVVSGLQLFDNKGRAVESYEPFFGRGYDYLPAGEADRGRRVLRFYDPRGEVVRTVHPDGSEERVVRGVPATPEDPDHFTPTPWESWRYDANDNVARSHPEATAAWIARHRDTPASITVDAMGHPVLAVSRTRAGAGAALEEHRTRSVFDVSGNVLAVLDPLGRVARRATYDLAGRPLRIRSLDAGETTTFLNVAGGPLETRDAKGARTLRACDRLGRPVRMWAGDAAGAALTLRERVEYGDGGDPAQPPAEREAARAANRLGHPARHFDEAGVVVFDRYDFRGRPAEKTRRVIAETRLLETFAAAAADAWRLRPLAVDWTPPAVTGFEAHAAALLGAREYRTSSAYDALGRARWVRAPADAAGARAEIRPAYNAGGQLERVRVDGTAYVEHVAYNAAGQRTLVAYGNGVMTRHAYHPRSARLVRSRTERYAVPAGSPLTFRSAPAAGQAHPLQDLAYGYDLNGNVLRITDRTPGCGVRANPDAATWQEQDPALAALLAAGDALVRRFEYDPLGRLETATGREAGGATAPRPWADAPAFGFGSGAHATPTQDNAAALSALYRETYEYDPAGNLVSLRHEAGSRAWTRRFGMDGSTPADWATLWPQHLDGALWTGAPSNRMTHAGDDLPGAARTHLYDPAGNLLRQNEDRHLAWDHANRLRLFRVQTPASGSAAGDDLWAEPSVCAHYLYDAGGQRVLKLVRKQGGAWEATVYVDGAWEHQRWTLGSGATGECVVQHVMDGPRRIALARTGDRHPDDGGPAVQYHLGDHLGSSTLVTDAAGGWANREEFTPFGESVFGSFARKRYRFTGMERDGESGLGYHGARYYAPWLCRWASADPAGLVDGTNLYAYCRGNPLRFSDPSGTSGLEAAAAAAVSTGAPVSGTAVTGAAGGALSGGAAAGGTGVAASSGAGAVATSTFQGYVGAGAAAEATAVVETGASATTWGMRALAVLETGSAAALVGVAALLIPGNYFDPIGTGAPVREPVCQGELPMSLPGQSGPAVQEPAASGPAVSEPGAAQAPVSEPAPAGPEMWAGRPNAARRNEHNYGGWYLDPFTNKAVTGYPEVTPADHIVPEYMIRNMPGFSKLTPEQQREVMNYQGNFQPLPKWLNSSKGAKTYMEWTEAPSKPGDPSSVKPFHPDYIKDMQLLTIQIMAELSAMVDYFRYGR
jgi:RHS repeat-associated protein